jgi:hypothetical protein
VSDASWWNWDEGSQLFFWRWPEFCKDQATDGVPIHFHQDLKAYLVHQPIERDPKIKKQQVEKLGKVLVRQYICLVDEVQSYTLYFSVPSKADDIRMVYDVSKSGLNVSIWVPRFPLPTIQTHLQVVTRVMDVGPQHWRNVPELPSSPIAPEGMWGRFDAIRGGA